MTLTLRISHYAFTIPSRFEEGTRLSAAEARAFNSLLAENIRNNVAGQVAARHKATGQAVLEWSDVDELQELILAYAEGYEFAQRDAGIRLAPLEAELKTVTGEMALAAGIFPGEEEWNETLERLAAGAEARQVARNRLLLKVNLAAKGL